LPESVIPGTGDASRRPVLADLHNLSLSLAREPEVISFARALAGRWGRPRGIPRLAGVFSFVGHLVDVPPPAPGEARDGVDVLLALAGERGGPALILAALLLALGERAFLARGVDGLYVRVEIEPGDLSRLPPFAQPVVSGGRCYLPLDPRRARSPLGFLPRGVREPLGGFVPVPAARQRPRARLRWRT
jgi:hypothetical protein